MLSILAQSNGDDAAAAGLAILIACGTLLCVLVVVLAVQALICYLLVQCLKRIPAEHRKIEPGKVWLLMIPLFNIVWNFFVFPAISDSFASYFRAQGELDKGDCNRSLAMAHCICVACSVIPYIGALPGFASLIILIIYLVKANELKSQIPQELTAETDIAPRL